MAVKGRGITDFFDEKCMIISNLPLIFQNAALLIIDVPCIG